MKTRKPKFAVKRIQAQRILGNVPTRTFARLEAEEIIIPSKRGKPGVPSVYDLAIIVPAYIAHLKLQSGRTGETESRSRRDRSQAELNELKLAERRGELIEVASVESEWAELVTEARNKLLGVPTHLKMRAVHLTREDISVCDLLIREALEELSANGHGDLSGQAGRN